MGNKDEETGQREIEQPSDITNKDKEEKKLVLVI